MTTTALTPRQPVPALNVALAGGERFVLGAQPGEKFDLIVFYRGLHCPICAKYLIELEQLVPEFEKRGVQVLAVSSDDAERSQSMIDKIKASHLRIGHDLSLPLEVSEPSGLGPFDDGVVLMGDEVLGLLAAGFDFDECIPHEACGADGKGGVRRDHHVLEHF